MELPNTRVCASVFSGEVPFLLPPHACMLAACAIPSHHRFSAELIVFVRLRDSGCEDQR